MGIKLFSIRFILNLSNLTETTQSYVSFLEGLSKTNYHGLGHLLIGEHCSPEGEEGNGPMGYDMVSARDPIFYRWHGHLEQLLQQFRDKHLPKYTLEDFQLSDQLKVEDLWVKSTINFSLIEPNENYVAPHVDVVDTLYLHTSYENVTYDEETSINEVHMNHHPFVTTILISNPKRVQKKVILRTWLGLELGKG